MRWIMARKPQCPANPFPKKPFYISALSLGVRVSVPKLGKRTKQCDG